MVMNRFARLACLVVWWSFFVPAAGRAAGPDSRAGDLPTWTSGPTSRSEWSWEQMKATLTFRLPPGYESMPRIDPSVGLKDALPERWDWREHGGLTPVKDQGNCGSCWAFASAGALEAAARLTDKVIYDVSEQQVLACNSFGEGCGGGSFDAAYDVFSTYGAIAEDCMPYRAMDGVACVQESFPPSVVATDLLLFREDIASIKAAVYTYGPIACAMFVFGDFMGYAGGCYSHESVGNVNHAVVIVGWDDNLCGGAWIVKNSWSEGWGDRGYFTIAYGSSDIGTYPCFFKTRPGRVISIQPVALESTLDGTLPFSVRASIRSLALAPINPDSVCLYYRVNAGSWVCANMAQDREPGYWTATIPPQEKPATVEYYLRAADAEQRRAVVPEDAPDSLYVFDVARELDACESGTSGWTVGSPDDRATSGLWEQAEPIGTVAQPASDHSARGTHAWITGQHLPDRDPGYNDVDGGRTTLTSPGYELTGSTTAVLKYCRWYSNDKGQNPGEDSWIVQARNGGGPWVDIENTTESSNGWVEVKQDLMPLFGPGIGLVQLRFIAQDDGAPSCVEAAIDDLAILAEQPEASAVHGYASAGNGPEYLTVDPNPASTNAVVRFTLPRQATIRLRVFAADGRLVRSLLEGAPLRPGEHAIAWDGRDGFGGRAPSGPYYWALDGEGTRRTGSMRILR
jgi:hypothetical protein